MISRSVAQIATASMRTSTSSFFGASDTPEWLDTIADLANFYLEFLDQLDLRDVHLVGSSLGGWIAADLAVRNASRLASLTLAGAAGIHVPGVPQVDTFLSNDEQ